jgi:group I intron endonuclease
MVNGKAYIGQTVKSLAQRWGDHVYHAMHGSRYLFHNAIRKYGPQGFLVEVLFRCHSKAEMDRKEQEAIVEMRTKSPRGYNLTDGGEGSVGFRHTEETRARMGRVHKGVPLTAEHRKKISIGGRGMKRSDATRMKISVAKMGNMVWRGRKHSLESRKKISDALVGRIGAWTGKKHTAETLTKMRAAWVIRKQKKAA